MKEGPIKKDIMDHLTLLEKQNKLVFCRTGCGSIAIHGRYFKTGKAGWPDITVLHNGLFIGIEVKKPDGEQSEAQKQMQTKIENCGGKYVLADSIEDVQALFNQ